MRVQGLRQTGTSGGAGTARGPRGAGFSAAAVQTEASRPAARMRNVLGPHGVDALLAVQAADDALSRRRRAVARGRNILDLLDDLRIGLLSGRASPDKLAELAALLAADPGAADSKELRRVLEAIELRARVELAKLGLTAE